MEPYEPDSWTEDAGEDRRSRGFGNLFVDTWHVVWSNPFLFVLLPVVVWFPIDLFAEYVALSQGGGFWEELRTYNRVSWVFGILVGAWLAAVLFNGVRRLAEGSEVTVGGAIRDGSKQYGHFLKTTWAFSWRVGLATLVFIVPGIIYSIRFALAIPVTTFEELDGKDAVYASREYMRGRSWQLFRYVVGFSLVFIPWAIAIVWLMPSEETPLLNALSTITFNILFTLWSIWLALIYVDATGRRDLTPPVGVAEVRLPDGRLRRDVPRGRKRLTTTTVLGVVAMLLVIFLYEERPFEGSRITFGDNQQHELYYDDDVEQTEVWAMGDALVALGWFDDEEPLAVRMGSDGSSYWLYIHIFEEWLADEEFVEFLQWTEDSLAEVFEKEIHIVMLVTTFSGVDEIPLGQEARRREKRRTGPEPDQPDEQWLGPSFASAIPEPVLETALENRDTAKWLEEWKEACGELFPWSFEFAGHQGRLLDTETGRGITRLAEGDTLDVLRSTLEWSPSNGFALSMFVDNLSRRDSAWSPRGAQPDWSVWLFRGSDGRGWPVLDIELPILLHSIGWADERTAVVLGIAPDADGECLYIWRLLVDDLYVRVERHRGPGVSASQRDRLAERSLAWVRSHYPEVQWASE